MYISARGYSGCLGGSGRATQKTTTVGFVGSQGFGLRVGLGLGVMVSCFGLSVVGLSQFNEYTSGA